MIRLLSAELLRARSRKLVKRLVLIGLAAIVIGSAIGAFKSHKPTAAEIASAKQQMAQAYKACVDHFQAHPKQLPPALTAAQLCASNNTLSSYLGSDQFDVNHVGDILKGTSITIIVMGWLIGASLAGAEWASGTMTTLLTWEPRRARVLAAKLIAGAFTVLVVALALQLVLVGLLWLVAVTRGLSHADSGLWRSVFGALLRVAAMSSLASVFGLSIAMLTRSVTAAVGAGFVYLAVVEGLIRGFYPNLERWLIGDNAAAWITGNRFSTTGLHEVTVERAAVVLLIYAAVFVIAAAVSFRSRDVT